MHSQNQEARSAKIRKRLKGEVIGKRKEKGPRKEGKRERKTGKGRGKENEGRGKSTGNLYKKENQEIFGRQPKSGRKNRLRKKTIGYAYQKYAFDSGDLRGIWSRIEHEFWDIKRKWKRTVISTRLSATEHIVLYKIDNLLYKTT